MPRVYPGEGVRSVPEAYGPYFESINLYFERWLTK